MSEAVNALFYIAHDKQIVSAAQSFHYGVLHPVYVLKLVYENHIVFAAKLLSRLLVVKQSERQMLEVVVIQQIFSRLSLKNSLSSFFRSSASFSA